MLKTVRINDFVKLSSFSTPSGCDEFYLAADTRPDAPFDHALNELAESYRLALEHAGLSDDTVAFSRLFVSDIENKKQPLAASPLFGRLTKGALSVIGQKPVNGGPLSLLSYHLRSGGRALPRDIRRISPDGWQHGALIKGNNYPLLFTANSASDAAPDVGRQTTEIFNSLADAVVSNGMHLKDDTIRTWVFVRDIDDNYGAMVNARKEYFAARGLTNATRYLASTGIQGTGPSPEQMVVVDSLSIGGLRPGQIVRMEARGHLPPTIRYGVTFERGLRIRFGDRSHLYISGTASIDGTGAVLFPGDAARQTERTIENMRALLSAHNAAIKNMGYMIAYVRNGEDRDAVRNVLARAIDKDMPLIFAEAAVCRPAWLVELEGVGIIPDTAEFPQFA